MSTIEDYDRVFAAARLQKYPVVDALEEKYGYAIDGAWLDDTARVLNCPVKVNPPNWQHGRVIYALLMVLTEAPPPEGTPIVVDVGTAKGFSACVIAKALSDRGGAWKSVPITSVDVVEPTARVRRNTVAEVDGFKTLYETMSPFVPPDVDITCVSGGSIKLLSELARGGARVPFAFVDGKHSYAAVTFEGKLLASMQKPGDIVLFDDCQLPEVWRAVRELTEFWVELVDIGPRMYALATRK